MAINDATVEVQCDGCGEIEDISPEYVYRDYSGKNGYYDTTDSAIEEKLLGLGWGVKDGKHYCEDCKSVE
jgi:hypothetical protein